MTADTPTPEWALLDWSPGLAAGVALGGAMIAVAGFTGGTVSIGAAGLLALGVAVGMVGTLRRRLVVAAMTWVGDTALAVGSGLAVDALDVLFFPMMIAVTVFGLGQAAAIVASIMLAHPAPEEEQG